MSAIDVSELLRPGLLQGVSVVVAGARAREEGARSLGDAVGVACAALGARVSECPLGSDGWLEEEDPALEERLDGVIGDAGGVALLAVDAASLFGRLPGGGRTALGVCLDASWNVTRAVVNRAYLPGGRGGRIVYLAPAPDAGEHADAACAGLENLARTLSIEWARHGITAVTIAPGASAPAGEAAALTAYLASPAGAYFSGCLLDLRGPGGTSSFADSV